MGTKEDVGLIPFSLTLACAVHKAKFRSFSLVWPCSFPHKRRRGREGSRLVAISNCFSVLSHSRTCFSSQDPVSIIASQKPSAVPLSVGGILLRQFWLPLFPVRIFPSTKQLLLWLACLHFPDHHPSTPYIPCISFRCHRYVCPSVRTSFLPACCLFLSLRRESSAAAQLCRPCNPLAPLHLMVASPSLSTHLLHVLLVFSFFLSFWLLFGPSLDAVSAP